ncbi:MAG: hypothetical protein ACOZNI_21745 [Myxococcota bacterium]
MTGDELAAAWAKVERAVEETARFPPGAFGAFGDVAAGEVVGQRRAEGWHVSWGLLGCTRPMAWLSITDDRPLQKVDALTEKRLEGRWSSSPKRLYQRLDLPWPFVDRHYVLDLQTNLALGAKGVWERWWTLDDRDLPPADDAQVVTRNEGAWLLVDVGDHTLAAYQVRVDLGGAVPDEAVRAYAASGTEELFRKVSANCASVAKRCEPGLPGGDGLPIACP